MHEEAGRLHDASTLHGGPCADCEVRNRGLCRGVASAELDVLFGQARRVIRRRSGQALFAQGETFDQVLVVRAGWVVVYKLFEDGRRQVMRFALPGDLLGFEGDDSVGMLYTAEALTDVSVCAIRRGAFRRACRDSPQLALNMARAMAHEVLTAWNHLGALGQHAAQGRIANLLLDLLRRVHAGDSRLNGGGRGAAVHLPLNQVHIADATGLTSVHVCRTLKRMRAAGLLEFTKGELMVLNGERLNALAQLDPDVLPVAGDTARGGPAARMPT